MKAAVRVWVVSRLLLTIGSIGSIHVQYTPFHQASFFVNWLSTCSGVVCPTTAV